MTRYHFHLGDGSQSPDEEGEELGGLEEAKRVALSVLTEVLPAKRQKFWEHKSFSVTVKDETGRMVVVITASAVVDPTPDATVPPEH